MPDAITQNPAKPKSQKWTSLLLKLAGLLLGFGIFYYVVQSYGGLDEIWFYLKKAGWGYFFVILNSLASIVLFTLAWQRFLPRSDHPIRFRALLKVRFCGEGVNFMTPLGFVAGDSVRVVLLQKYLGPQSHMRSVIVDRIMHTLAAHIFNFLCLFFLVKASFGFPAYYSWPLIIFYGITSYLMTQFTINVLAGRGSRLLNKIFNRFKIAQKFPSFHARVEEIREDLGYYKDKPKRVLWQSFALHFVGRTLGIVEIALCLWALEGRWEWQFSAALTAVTSFVTVTFGFIPGAFGPLETLYAEFFGLYGMSPQVGISIQLIRRLRTFFWIGVGIFLIDYKHVSEKFWKSKKTAS